MFYRINNQITECDVLPNDNYIAIIPMEQAIDFYFIKKYMKKIPILLMDLHFSKLECFSDFIYGLISIPEILIKDGGRISFIITSQGIIFIDKNNYISSNFKKVLELYRDNIASVGAVLYYLLDYVISKDLEKMNSIQQNLAGLEQDILNGHNSEPIKEITDFRHNTMRLYHYYIQFAGICSDLCNDNQNFFIQDEELLFSTLSNKVSLLGHEAQQIWEYTSQIRDVYQQQLEVHQNSIMKVLTIVTTIFMPLTLITGWYGMNFVHMPELSWNYSYPSVLFICIIVAVVLCIIFKKKKWW